MAVQEFVRLKPRTFAYGGTVFSEPRVGHRFPKPPRRGARHQIRSHNVFRIEATQIDGV